MARYTMTKEITLTEVVLARMGRKDGKSFAEDLPSEKLLGNVSFGKAQERMREKIRRRHHRLRGASPSDCL